MKPITVLLLLAVTASIPDLAVAQVFPSKPVRIIVPYPPGGGADIHTRLMAQKLTTVLGQPVVVENRAGASGNIGSDYVAKSAPDGYTLLKTNTNITIAPAFSTKLTYNVLTDFSPIATTLSSQNLLVVRPSLPVTSVKELVAYAKANPGKLTYGSSGVGTPMLSIELIKMLAGLDIVHVPYKGDAPALTDLIGGQIDMYAANISAVDQHYRSGKLRGLAVTSGKRAASLPEVPTMEQAGIAGYELQSWFGFLAPANTPRQVVDTLNAAFLKVVAMPDVQQQMIASGSTPMPSSPQEFAQIIKDYVEKFSRIVKSAGIKVE